MKLIRQPSSWSCAAAAAAMVFDCSIESMFRRIGHDGSEIIFPELRDPACRKGFHMQEIIDVALIWNYTMTPIELAPVQTPDGKNEFEITKFHLFKSPQLRYEYYVKKTRGLIEGIASKFWHTVAYDRGKVYDSRGRIYGIKDLKINVQRIWVVSKNQIIFGK